MKRKRNNFNKFKRRINAKILDIKSNIPLGADFFDIFGLLFFCCLMIVGIFVTFGAFLLVEGIQEKLKLLVQIGTFVVLFSIMIITMHLQYVRRQKGLIYDGIIPLAKQYKDKLKFTKRVKKNNESDFT